MGGDTEPSLGLGNLDRASSSSHHDETIATSKENDLSQLSSDERRATLQKEFARMLVRVPAALHIHAVTDFAITYFEVRGGTDRKFRTVVIDEDGELHEQSSTLRD